MEQMITDDHNSWRVTFLQCKTIPNVENLSNKFMKFSQLSSIKPHVLLPLAILQSWSYKHADTTEDAIITTIKAKAMF